MECITSWIREVPLGDIINSPLMDVVTNALQSDISFESAVECFTAIFRETRDVDEYLEAIKTLYPRIITQRSRLAQVSAEEDAETFKGLTRMFAEAGEAWVVLIARMPNDFRALVETILECAARDREKDAISLTFNFWYELKQYVTLDRYVEARAQFADIYSKLVDVMVSHLEFPKPEGPDASDLFEGDREQEDKFREFRHQMGDVLKDCCEVLGVTACLTKTYEQIEQWVGRNGAEASQGRVPNWQQLSCTV